MIKPIKKQWIVVDKRGFPIMRTLAIRKRDCIGIYEQSIWKKLKLIGYRCKRVNITFEVL